MHLRSLVHWTLCLPCVARRSLRLHDLRHDTEQLHNAIAKALEVSAEVREVLVPEVHAVGRTGAWKPFGPRRAEIAKRAYFAKPDNPPWRPKTPGTTPQDWPKDFISDAARSTRHHQRRPACCNTRVPTLLGQRRRDFLSAFAVVALIMAPLSAQGAQGDNSFLDTKQRSFLDTLIARFEIRFDGKRTPRMGRAAVDSDYNDLVDLGRPLAASPAQRAREKGLEKLEDERLVKCRELPPEEFDQCFFFDVYDTKAVDRNAGAGGPAQGRRPPTW